MSSLNMKSAVVLAAASLIVSACADTESVTMWETPNVVNRPSIPEPQLDPIPEKTYERASGSARGEGLKYDPRVDILFVIDNSNSMVTHQTNLRTNINQFVSALAKTKAIDYHIGVTTVYDSVRYGSVVQKTCGGQTNYLEKGELSPLKGTAVPLVQRFVTKKESLSVLQHTLNVGVAEFKNAKPGTQECSTGPEEEESFSPIIGSFDLKNTSGNNGGFWREGSLKVVMLVTDAEDGSKELTASSVADELYRLSGSTPDDQKFRVYAVTAIPGQKVSSDGYIGGSKTCRLDFGFRDANNGVWPSSVPNHNVAELVKISGGKMLSICNKNYGSELAKVGEEIRVATLKDIVYDLPQIPERSKGRDIQVWFRQDEKTSVALEEGKHWNYDPNLNRIVVKGFNLNWDEYPNAYIDVDYYIFNQKDPFNKTIQ